MNEDLLNAKILIMDDQPNNVEMLELLLESRGFTDFRSLTDSREFMSVHREYQPDLVLLDLQMPHIEGFELLQLMHDEAPSESYQPVLVLTADATPETNRRALGLGATDFLTKPLDHTEVLLRIRNLLNTRRLHLLHQDHNRMLDVTVRERTAELEQALDELRQVQDRLVAQERMKAMGEMAAGVAHDFNNAVSIVMGYSDMLLEFPELMEDRVESRQSLETIATAARDAASIVKRLREFYSPADEPAEVNDAADLRGAGETAIALTQPRWRNQAQAEGRNIKIKTDLHSVRVGMNTSKVREILTNLIFNAVDAMTGDGAITIISRREEDSGVLKVCDNGSGMPEEIRRQCLEPFFTTKGDRGTGLGLGMVHSMVQRHGGELEISSEPGKGTEITIRLPLHDPVPGDEQYLNSRTLRALKILLIDDDEEVRTVLRKQLERSGHACVACVDGAEALAKFHSEHFDLVVTDRSMPKLSGDQVAQALHHQAPELPIIMLTGFGDKMSAHGELPPGVRLLLSKPINLRQLRDALTEAIQPAGAESMAVSPSLSVKAVGAVSALAAAAA